MSTTDPEDRFREALGDARGVTDARVLRACLGSAELERDEAWASAQSLQTELGALWLRGTELSAELLTSRAALLDARADLEYMERERDMARYAAMFAGAPDPITADSEVHHGEWTPGRPYLDGQHVTHPVSVHCYRAHTGGVPAGLMPDGVNGWVLCQEVCPYPERVFAGPHPVSSGAALRQHKFWWDQSGERWALADLTAEHLTAVIDWLPEHVDALWQPELRCSVPRVPCPPDAYEFAEDWLADTPLMRALLAEAQRRGLQAGSEEQQP
jgi:hypothetical protein